MIAVQGYRLQFGHCLERPISDNTKKGVSEMTGSASPDGIRNLVSGVFEGTKNAVTKHVLAEVSQGTVTAKESCYHTTSPSSIGCFSLFAVGTTVFFI